MNEKLDLDYEIIANLTAENATLKAENEKLKEQVEWAERQLNRIYTDGSVTQ